MSGRSVHVHGRRHLHTNLAGEATLEIGGEIARLDWEDQLLLLLRQREKKKKKKSLHFYPAFIEESTAPLFEYNGLTCMEAAKQPVYPGLRWLRSSQYLTCVRYLPTRYTRFVSCTE
jgi:hypothetical protein